MPQIPFSCSALDFALSCVEGEHGKNALYRSVESYIEEARDMHTRLRAENDRLEGRVAELEDQVSDLELDQASKEAYEEQILELQDRVRELESKLALATASNAIDRQEADRELARAHARVEWEEEGKYRRAVEIEEETGVPVDPDELPFPEDEF